MKQWIKKTGATALTAVMLLGSAGVMPEGVFDVLNIAASADNEEDTYEEVFSTESGAVKTDNEDLENEDEDIETFSEIPDESVPELDQETQDNTEYETVLEESNFTGEEFVIDADGVLTAYNGTGGNVVIPDGVTAIGNSVFKNNSALRTISFPDSVVSIGQYSFQNCTNLSNVVLPKKLTTLGYCAFDNCDSITSIIIPASVTTCGAYSPYGNEYSPFTHCDNLVSAGFEYGTTKIAANVFYYCTLLKNVTIPETVTSIGDSAFEGCTFEEIELPSALTEIGQSTFKGCTKLNSIDFPGTLKIINHYAFQNCTNLSNVVLPKKLTTLGYGAFDNCDSITSIIIPASVTTCGAYSPYGNEYSPFTHCDNLVSAEFEYDTTKIAANVFYYCTSLKNVTIPETVTSIGDNSFTGCTFEEIELPFALTEIGQSAFKGCTELKSIDFPGTLKIINHYAFQNCTKLADVVLPKKLTTLGYGAFDNCDSITSIIIPASVTTCGAYSPYGNEYSPFTHCDNLVSAEFEYDTTKIAANVFYYCTSLKNVTIPETVTTIGDSAFVGCTSLEEVELPFALTEIGQSAFKGCTKLNSIYFPRTLKIINNYAFQNCSKLADVVLPKKLTTLGYGAFDNCDSITSIIIPASVTTCGAYSPYDNEYSPFTHCDNLVSAEFAEGCKSVVDNVFYYCTSLKNVIIPETVTSIGNNSFKGCKFEEIELPSDLTTINNSAFAGCASLKEIDIPDTVNSMGTNVFSDCTSLEKVHIPVIKVIIQDGMFNNCVSLKEINFPETLEQLGKNVFYNCDSLTTVTLPEKVNTIGENGFKDCDGLISVTIPSVKSIGNQAFYDCDALKTVVIAGAGSIGSEAFRDCNLLDSVDLGDYLGTLGASAFRKCPKLAAVTIPSPLEKIPDYAFADSVKLVSVYIPDSVTTIATSAFSYPGVTTIYGSDGSAAQTYAANEDFDFEITENYYPFTCKAEKYPDESIKLIWDAVDGATKYSVAYIDTNGIYRRVADNITDTEYDISDLSWSGTLKFIVRVYKNNRYSDYKTSNYISVSSGLGKVGAISTLNYKINDTSVDLSWSAASNAKGYIVYIKNNGVWKEHARTDSTVRQYTVENLSAGRNELAVCGYFKSFSVDVLGEKYPVEVLIESDGALSISSYEITITNDSFVYDGTAKIIGQHYIMAGVYVGSEYRLYLEEGLDYTLSYKNNINAGTATVTATGIGAFTGTTSKTFTISPKSVSSATVTLGTTSYIYDGNAKKPTVTVNDGTKTLTGGTDYTVEYSNNINVGTATATIAGKGNYTGIKTADFIIQTNVKPITVDMITLGASSYVYDGTAKRPAVTVKDGTTTLSGSTDYTVSYSDNTNAGTATVTVTGKGNYSGTASKTFTISAKSISDTTVTLGTTSYTYDGTAKMPTVTVNDGTKTLIKGTEYTVSYKDNIEVGTATVTIKGKDNYSGTVTASFTILKKVKPISDTTITLSETLYAYDGTAKKPTVTVIDGTTTLVNGTDYTVSYSDNINAGTATVTVTGNGNYSETAAITFTINAKLISGTTITLDATAYTYDGTAKKPKVTVKDGTKTLTKDTDYTVAYSNNTDVGTATVTVTGKGNYKSTKKITFVINPKPTDSPFEWGKDNWNFNNSNAVCYSGLRINNINNTYLNKLENSLNNVEYYYVFDRNNGYLYKNYAGNCYGMSALLLLAKNGIVPYPSFTPDADCLKELYTPSQAKLNLPSEQYNVTSLITYYHMLQMKTSVQQKMYYIWNQDNKTNIEQLISLLKDNSVVMLCYCWNDGSKTYGHAVIAYDCEYGSFNKGGQTYNGRILTWDPNSSLSINENTYLYFTTSNNWDWSIPCYTNCSSKKGAAIDFICSSVDLINDGGYLPGGNYSSSDSFVAKLDAYKMSSESSVVKVVEGSDGRYYNSTGTNDIYRRRSRFYGDEGDATDGYALYDGNASYKVSQSEYVEMELSLEYEKCCLLASTIAGKEILFDNKGYVSVKGDSSDYSIGMIFNEDYPTDWYSIEVQGTGANNSSLEKTVNGWIINSDNLNFVQVNAHNRSDKAEATFSTGYNKALIYEIDKNTIGIKLDTDDNGTFETELPLDSGDNIKVNATPGDSEVTLTWDAVDGAAKYAAYLVQVDGTLKALATKLTNTTYTAANLTNGTEYTFLVRAYVNSKWSKYSANDYVKATPVSTVVKPEVTATPGDEQVILRWNAIDSAERYAVYCIDPTGTTAAAKCLTSRLTATTLTVSKLTNGVTYKFYVRAYVNGKWTAFDESDYVNATPVSSVVKPTVEVIPADKQVTLTWDAIDGATKYAVYRLQDDGTLKALATKLTVTEYTIKKLVNHTEYQFLVRAYVNGKWTKYDANDYVNATPAALKPLVRVSEYDGMVTLRWGAVDDATKYAAYIVNNDGSLTCVSSKITNIKYTVKKLTNGTAYRFVVRAYVNGKWTKYTDRDIVTATPHA